MIVGTVRTAIAAAVHDGVTDTALACKGFMPDQPPLPSFCVAEVEIPDPRTTFRGKQTALITCYVFTSTLDDQVGQARLDTYLSETGDDSVLAALYAARATAGAKALSGNLDALVVQSIDGYRKYRVGEMYLFGARILLKAIG